MQTNGSRRFYCQPNNQIHSISLTGCGQGKFNVADLVIRTGCEPSHFPRVDAYIKMPQCIMGGKTDRNLGETNTMLTFPSKSFRNHGDQLNYFRYFKKNTLVLRENIVSNAINF